MSRDNTRECIVSCRVTKETYQELLDLAETLQVSMSLLAQTLINEALAMHKDPNMP